MSGLAPDATPTLRVVRIYCRLPPLPGGMELHIARLSAAQRGLGIEVINIYNQGEAEGPSIQICAGLDLDRIRPQSLRNLVFYALATVNAGRLRSKTPTVLHVHGAWSDFVFSKILGQVTGADATFASMHGVVRPRWHWLYRAALSHCSAIFATGKSDQEFLAHAVRRDVIHLPSGVASEFTRELTAPTSPFHFDVVDVANLVPKKRLDLVLECARLRPQLRFAIVGEGPLRRDLEDSIAALGLTNVSLLGRLNSGELASVLRASRVFVSPSEEEGSPTAALEAMAVGIPVILAPSNNFNWLITDGLNGFVTTGWAASEFVDRLDEILRDEERRKEIGARNRARMKDYDWPKIAMRVTALMNAKIAQGCV